ncbi:MAG: hypothetical protein E6Q99_09525 [Elusimicrobia bacterium]|jgi:hypothetical protein|nr:MAG: hypothetical protein E6Q99_09525 [Elusimicrobiota bacterium]
MNNMTPEEKERYVRWQDYRVTQTSFVINLFLGFAVASLAYAINLKFEGKPHGNAPLETTIILWAASTAAGALATMSKLLDYRHTARKIKDGGVFNTFMAKWCGPVTWGCLWVQVVSYAWGAFLFINGVLNA